MGEWTIGGRYRLEREIAHGGMGAVWLAVDLQLQRNVAVKVMTSDQFSSVSSRQWFAREAQAVAHLTSPHVVQIHDYGIDGEVSFLVMELLEGEDLEARLGKQPRLPLPMIASILSQASKALGLAHRAGIVHRDLKPANMFLARVGGEEVLKLLDFGVASWATGAPSSAPDGAEPQYLVGTPLYLSPEQAWGTSKVDHRSDLWSLGVIAYRALTGVLPFSARSLGEVAIKIYSEASPPPSSVVPGVSPALDGFFERALARDPAARFQTASDMASAFLQILEETGPLKPAKILVVDDEPDVAALVTQYFSDQLRSGAYEFIFAADGAEALQKLHDHADLDLALTDLHMPRMGGLAFLERAREINPVLKTVVVSAYGDMVTVRKAMNRGAFDFLVKPIDLEDLQLTIEKTLSQVRERRKTLHSIEENSVLRMHLNSGTVERLLPGGHAARGADELVRATVAFIDVCGFNAAAERLSPAEAIHLLNTHFEIIVPEITSRGGAVDKFLGNAVMVVFRGPDHVTQAIEACLSIRRQLGAEAAREGAACGVAMGLDTGEVLAGSIGSKHLSRLEQTVLGRVVGTAARLLWAAGRDHIFISERVHQALSGAFERSAAGLPGTTTGGPPERFYTMSRAGQEAQSGAQALIEDRV